MCHAANVRDHELLKWVNANGAEDDALPLLRGAGPARRRAGHFVNCGGARRECELRPPPGRICETRALRPPRDGADGAHRPRLQCAVSDSVERGQRGDDEPTRGPGLLRDLGRSRATVGCHAARDHGHVQGGRRFGDGRLRHGGRELLSRLVPRARLGLGEPFATAKASMRHALETLHQNSTSPYSSPSSAPTASPACIHCQPSSGARSTRRI